MTPRPLAAALAIAACATLGAQSASPGLSIDAVIAATLKENPDVLSARAAIEAERGVLVQAGRPFDVRPVASLTASRTEEGAGLTVTDPTTAARSTVETGSRIGVSRLFRSGVGITTEAAITRTDLRSLESEPFNQFRLTTGVSVPLLQGRGGGLDTARERAAALDYRASGRTLRATAGAAVLASTVAYWEYRAAVQRAAIQRAAAGRARQSVDEVRILISADERPQSDIDLMMANAATKQAGELEAERQVVQTRLALALAIGLDFDAAAALSAPSSDFPPAEQAPAPPLDELIADAIEHHDQLAVAATRRESANVVREGATRQMTPRFDVIFGAGYSGENRGAALGRTLGSVFAGVRGPNVSVQFLFEPASVNSSLRGTLIEAGATHTQATVAWERLARAVRLNVADALTGLNSSRAQLVNTREAVEHARRARETVQRNFELGTATLFDRILAEDTVTNAELADLAAALRHATALVHLQYARGVLVDSRDGDLTADPARVLRVAREDAR